MTERRGLEQLTLPDILRRDPDEVTELQDSLIAETVALCYRGHPFYRSSMKSRGLEPGDIRSVADLERLPVTRKEDFLADPEAFRLRLDDLPADMRTLWEVVYTTGTTTGTPAPVYTTTFDHYSYMFNARRRREFVPIQRGDLVANLFPLTEFPMGAYTRASAEAAACGAGILFAHTGRVSGPFDVHRSLDEAVELVAEHHATVLWGVAGFVRRVLIRASEMAADFSHVRMVMITGEASSPAMRADMRSRMLELGCADPVVVNRYGSTEQGSSMVECEEGSGFHNLAPDQILLEVVDPDGGHRLPDGHEGMVAFSHLIRRGTVLLRYAVGDVASLTHETCPYCGRTSSARMSSQAVRRGSIVKIKGTLVNLKTLRDELDRVQELDEYQVVIQHQDEADPYSGDELLLRMAVSSSEDATSVADRITELVIERTHVRPRLEFVTRDEIFDPHEAAKPRRVVDRREIDQVDLEGD